MKTLTNLEIQVLAVQKMAISSIFEGFGPLQNQRSIFDADSEIIIQKRPIISRYKDRNLGFFSIFVSLHRSRLI